MAWKGFIDEDMRGFNEEYNFLLIIVKVEHLMSFRPEFTLK